MAAASSTTEFAPTRTEGLVTRFSLQPQADADLIMVQGNLDLATAPSLRVQIETAQASGIRNIVVDLDHSDLFDPAALGVLLDCARASERVGGVLCIVTSRVLVRRLLSMTALNRTLLVFPTREEALLATAIPTVEL